MTDYVDASNRPTAPQLVQKEEALPEIRTELNELGAIASFTFERMELLRVRLEDCLHEECPPVGTTETDIVAPRTPLGNSIWSIRATIRNTCGLIEDVPERLEI